MERPPFDLPFHWRKKGTRGWKRVHLPPLSDGDPRTWPGNDVYRIADERNYLIQLATEWIKSEGTNEDNILYWIDKLPAGYALFEIDQQNGGGQVWKRLFGHPSGRFFDSIVKFQVHFKWLMGGRQGRCLCLNCSQTPLLQAVPRPRPLRLQPKPFKRTQSRESTMSTYSDTSSGSQSVDVHGQERRRPQRRQAPVAPEVDEEGTVDVWADGFRRLEKDGGRMPGIEFDIEEPDSVDWVAERDTLPRYLTQIQQQHSFTPRLGELVLWVPQWPKNHHLVRDLDTEEYKFYSFEESKFHGFPSWRGGIVASVPSAQGQNGSLDFGDLIDLPEKKTSINLAGFRIETTPDPNDDSKSLSKQYKYVPLSSIRPLSHWQVLLKGVSESELHPSIMNALTSLTTISLVEKWRFNGIWPNGTIFSEGIYLGAELITVGDAVRLIPRKTRCTTRCTDVLVVESIRYQFEDIQPTQTPFKPLHPNSRSYITLVGAAFTTDIHRAHDMPSDTELLTAEAVQLPSPLTNEDVKTIFRPVGTARYGPWYQLHSDKQRYEVSYDEVLGRLLEADAFSLWSGQRQMSMTDEMSSELKVDLDLDVSGVVAGRQYASQVNSVLPEPGKDPEAVNWYLADTRAQALTIASVNGVEVSSYDHIRTPATLKSWRAHLKIANGVQPDGSLLRDINQAKESPLHEEPIEILGKKRGRPKGSKVIDGRLYRASELGHNFKEARAISDKSGSRSSIVDKFYDTENRVWPPDANAEFREIRPISPSTESRSSAINEFREIKPISPSTESRSSAINEFHTEKQHNSQMAEAALVSTDEEDITVEIQESSEEPEEMPTPLRNRFSLQREAVQPVQPRQTTAKNREISSKVSRAGDRHVGANRKKSSKSSSSGSDRSIHLPRNSRLHSQAASKSSTRLPLHRDDKGTEEEDDTDESVKARARRAHQAYLENTIVLDPIPASSDSEVSTRKASNSNEDEEILGDEWKHNRNARGGTEETEGGDYRPGQD